MIAHKTRSGKTGAGSLRQLVKRLEIRHLNIAVVFIELVTAGCSSRSSEVAIAEEQIDNIIKVCKSWDEHWADVEATSALSKTSFHYKTFLPDPEQTGLILNQADAPHKTGTPPVKGFPLKFQDPNWTLNTENDDLRNPAGAMRLTVPTPLTARPLTLSDFHSFWNLLNQHLLIKVPKALNSHLDVYREYLSTGAYPATWQAQFAPADTTIPYHQSVDLIGAVVPSQGTPPNSTAYSSVYSAYYFSPNVTVVIPILNYDTLPFDGQARFINAVGSAKWQRGSYENTFKALHELTADFEPLDLDKIKTILDKQKRGDNLFCRCSGWNAMGWAFFLLAIFVCLYAKLKKSTAVQS